MKIGKNDKKVRIQFTEAEFKMLQDNAYQMVETFGLDSRISRLKGKRPISFYSWDLACLEAVFDEMKQNESDISVVNSIIKKIELGFIEIG